MIQFLRVITVHAWPRAFPCPSAPSGSTSKHILHSRHMNLAFSSARLTRPCSFECPVTFCVGALPKHIDIPRSLRLLLAETRIWAANESDQSGSCAQVKSGATHPWYYVGDDGKMCRTIQLHPLNKRSMQSNIQSFALGISRQGLVQGVAGEPWLMWSTNPVSCSAALLCPLFASRRMIMLSFRKSIFHRAPRCVERT